MKKDITQARRFLIDRLGYARNRANLSARELSQRLGYSVAYIAKFDNGDFSMPAEVLLDAINICGMTSEEFFFHDLNKYKEDKEILSKVKDKTTIVAINKNDLEQKIEKKELEEYQVVSTNTNTIEGIDSLKEEKDKIKDNRNIAGQNKSIL